MIRIIIVMIMMIMAMIGMISCLDALRERITSDRLNPVSMASTFFNHLMCGLE